MSEDGDAFELVEQANDHRDRADSLITDAEQAIADELRECYAFEVEVDVSCHPAGPGFIARVLPVSEVTDQFGDEPVTVTPMMIRIGKPESVAETQRSRIKNLKDLVSRLESKYEEGAPITVVLDHAETEFGLDRENAEDEIEKLRRKGELYEPVQNQLRTT